jgi:hypothetical protein
LASGPKGRTHINNVYKKINRIFEIKREAVTEEWRKLHK